MAPLGTSLVVALKRAVIAIPVVIFRGSRWKRLAAGGGLIGTVAVLANVSQIGSFVKQMQDEPPPPIGGAPEPIRRPRAVVLSELQMHLPDGSLAEQDQNFANEFPTMGVQVCGGLFDESLITASIHRFLGAEGWREFSPLSEVGDAPNSNDCRQFRFELDRRMRTVGDMDLFGLYKWQFHFHGADGTVQFREKQFSFDYAPELHAVEAPSWQWDKLEVSWDPSRRCLALSNKTKSNGRSTITHHVKLRPRGRLQARVIFSMETTAAPGSATLDEFCAFDVAVRNRRSGNHIQLIVGDRGRQSATAFLMPGVDRGNDQPMKRDLTLPQQLMPLRMDGKTRYHLLIDVTPIAGGRSQCDFYLDTATPDPNSQAPVASFDVANWHSSEPLNEIALRVWRNGIVRVFDLRLSESAQPPRAGVTTAFSQP